MKLGKLLAITPLILATTAFANTVEFRGTVVDPTSSIKLSESQDSFKKTISLSKEVSDAQNIQITIEDNYRNQENKINDGADLVNLENGKIVKMGENITKDILKNNEYILNIKANIKQNNTPTKPILRMLTINYI